MKNIIAAFIVFMYSSSAAYSIDMEFHHEHETKNMAIIEERILKSNHCDIVFINTNNSIVLNYVKSGILLYIYYPDHINKMRDLAINKNFLLVDMKQEVPDDLNKTHLIKIVSRQAIEQDEECGMPLTS